MSRRISWGTSRLGSSKWISHQSGFIGIMGSSDSCANLLTDLERLKEIKNTLLLPNIERHHAIVMLNPRNTNTIWDDPWNDLLNGYWKLTIIIINQVNALLWSHNMDRILSVRQLDHIKKFEIFPTLPISKVNWWSKLSQIGVIELKQHIQEKYWVDLGVPKNDPNTSSWISPSESATT